MARPVEVEGQTPIRGDRRHYTSSWPMESIFSLSKSAEPERREGETDERRERLGEMGVRCEASSTVDVLVLSASGKTLVFIAWAALTRKALHHNPQHQRPSSQLTGNRSSRTGLRSQRTRRRGRSGSSSCLAGVRVGVRVRT